MNFMTRYADYLLLLGVITTLSILVLAEHLAWLDFAQNVTNTLAAWLFLTAIGLALTVLADTLGGRHDADANHGYRTDSTPETEETA